VNGVPQSSHYDKSFDLISEAPDEYNVRLPTEAPKLTSSRHPSRSPSPPQRKTVKQTPFGNIETEEEQQKTTKKEEKSLANKRRWAHLTQKPLHVVEEQVNEVIDNRQFSKLEDMLEGFWRSICEAKLLPLTTDFFEKDSVRLHWYAYPRLLDSS